MCLFGAMWDWSLELVFSSCLLLESNREGVRGKCVPRYLNEKGPVEYPSYLEQMDRPD